MAVFVMLKWDFIGRQDRGNIFYQGTEFTEHNFNILVDFTILRIRVVVHVHRFFSMQAKTQVWQGEADK